VSGESEISSQAPKLRAICLDLNVAVEVPAEADPYDDEGALFLVERCWVRGGSVWDPSCVDEVRSCALPGLEQRLGLSHGENPVLYAAGCCGALCVPVSGGETPLVVFGSWETSV